MPSKDRVAKLAGQARYRAKNVEALRVKANAYNVAHRAEQHAYYLAHREDRLARSKTHQAALPDRGCGKAKAWYQANPERAKASRVAWYEANRDRAASYSRQWQEAHPEQRHEAARRYKQRRRSLLYLIEYEYVDVLMLAARDGWLCQLCGLPVDPQAKGAWGKSHAHIVAVTRGGPNTYANAQLAHMRCNQAKFTSPAPPDNWRGSLAHA
jgi:5-methylcytosine-specific restriction endonuclease McrA